MDGQSISEISRVTGRDRKTIRKYISLIRQEEIGEGETLSVDKLLSIAEKSRKPSDKQIIFEPYIDEIKDFLINKQNLLKSLASLLLKTTNRSKGVLQKGSNNGIIRHNQKDQRRTKYQ